MLRCCWRQRARGVFLCCEAERERYRLYEAGLLDDWRIGGGGDD